MKLFRNRTHAGRVLATKLMAYANRSDVLVLLRERRYEEALARLYQARADTPGSVEVQKGIDQVKEFLIDRTTAEQ